MCFCVFSRVRNVFVYTQVAGMGIAQIIVTDNELRFLCVFSSVRNVYIAHVYVHTQVAGMSTAKITVTGSATITNCISNNFGGAIYVNDSSTLGVSGNVQVSSNFAGSKGGAVYTEGATVTLEGACRLQNVRILCVVALLWCELCVCVYTYMNV
jgi:predicted outer membrane repeat protein